MVAERHVPGTEFGELQLAIWKQQFQALRDGDRFFYLNDPVLREIERRFGIDYRRTLGADHRAEHRHRRAGQRVRRRRGLAARTPVDARRAPLPAGLSRVLGPVAFSARVSSTTM